MDQAEMDSLGTSLGGEAEDTDRKKMRKKKPEGKSNRILKTKRLRGLYFPKKILFWSLL